MKRASFASHHSQINETTDRTHRHFITGLKMRICPLVWPNSEEPLTCTKNGTRNENNATQDARVDKMKPVITQGAQINGAKFERSIRVEVILEIGEKSEKVVNNGKHLTGAGTGLVG